MGVAWSSFPAEALGALRALISNRVASVPTTLPPKARRNQEPEPAQPRERSTEPTPKPTPVVPEPPTAAVNRPARPAPPTVPAAEQASAEPQDQPAIPPCCG